MLPVFCLIFKLFNISSITFLAAKTNQNEKKITPPSLDCQGLPENAFQVNQLYNVTWSSVSRLKTTPLHSVQLCCVENLGIKHDLATSPVCRPN